MDPQRDNAGNDPVPSMDRRGFLRSSAVFGLGAAALAASLKPLLQLKDFTSMENFLQKYYKEMTPEDMAKVIKRIEGEVERQYGVRPHVRDLKPMDGVEFVYASTSPAASAAASACMPVSPRTTSRAARKSNTSGC